MWAMGDKKDESNPEIEFTYYEAIADLQDSRDVNEGLRKELEEAIGHLQRVKAATNNEHREHIGVQGMRWGKERTVADVYNAMTDEQKSTLHYIVGEALDQNNPSEVDLAKLVFEVLPFEQRRLACWFFSDAIGHEIVELYPSGEAYRIYNYEMDENLREWIRARNHDLKDYVAGERKHDDPLVAYLLRHVAAVHERVKIEKSREEHDDAKTYYNLTYVEYREKKTPESYTQEVMKSYKEYRGE